MNDRKRKLCEKVAEKNSWNHKKLKLFLAGFSHFKTTVSQSRPSTPTKQQQEPGRRSSKQSWRDFFQPLFIVGRLAEGGGDGDGDPTHKVDPTRLTVTSASKEEWKTVSTTLEQQPLARNSKIGNDSSSFQKQPLCWRPKSKVWRSHFILLLWWFFAKSQLLLPSWSQTANPFCCPASDKSWQVF